MEGEFLIRNLLATVNYDSVDNFIKLYEAFQNSPTETLREVFKDYNPPIGRDNVTCVGLSLDLIRRFKTLESRFPGLDAAMYLVSCEEAVDEDVRNYVDEDPTREAEKEHVMVAIKIMLEGRPGLLIADPGYHVARVLTVMEDNQYPHTDWFTKSEELQSIKKYRYVFNSMNTDYVEWEEREQKAGIVVKQMTSLVYVARSYMTSVEVTEKRNLVYNFRSLTSRDYTGYLTSGIYFPIVITDNDPSFTLFFDVGSGKKKMKYKFSEFRDPDNLPERILEEVEICNRMLNYRQGKLRGIITYLGDILENHSFISQLLALNRVIVKLSSTN